jgi:hypothetical protein
VHFLTLFSLCFAATEEEVLRDAQVTVEFLQQELKVSEGKPAATGLLYFILTALQLYYPRAAYAAWEPIDMWVMLGLQAGYGALIPQFPWGVTYTTGQQDDERAVANVICDWASNDMKQPGAFEPADYYPGLKMFIILHTVAVGCRHEPTKQRAGALATKWLAGLDLEQFTLCEFIMIDVYRWANEATWEAYPLAAADFFHILEGKTLWEVPRGYSQVRWQDWLGLLDEYKLPNPAARNSIDPSTYTWQTLVVFDLFELFLNESVWYIRELVGTGSGRDNASHMIRWMQRMWTRVEVLLWNDHPSKVNVPNQLSEITAELGL